MPPGWIMPVPAGQEAAVAEKTEVTTAMNAISSTMLEATTNLAENLAQSEPFLRYKAAAGRLEADAQAMQLLADLSKLQQKIRKSQYSGAVSEKDLARLRSLQTALSTSETIQDYQLTQELAVAFLREVNQEISNLVGIDFASLTRRAGGCC